MKAIETQIDIRAEAPVVWDVLTDFAAYEAWNPFIHSIRGEARPGARLRVRVEPVGQSILAFRTRVVHCQPGRELRWVGRTVMPGVLDGTHQFRIAACGVGVRFYQCLTVSGMAVSFLGDDHMLALQQGFDLMNQALCERAETQAMEIRDVA